MLLGPIMGDVEGLVLTAADRQRLMHPLMGGVIFFARNYANPAQLAALAASIRELRTPHLMIAVDHEGGRVQRFREGFTTIPPMRLLGQRWKANPAEARKLAHAVGVVIGTELVAHGLDFSFAPVLDLDWGGSTVIGDRSFGRDAETVAALAGAVVAGLAAVGVASCAKHFPGHGFVKADSHHEIPRDTRSFNDIADDDMAPFKLLADKFDSVMPAHIIFEQVDAMPAGFSSHWLKNVLREQLGFRGVIFSDDLTMEGASVVGGDVARAMAALGAGCDMALLCNDQTRCSALLAGLVAEGVSPEATRSEHLTRMHAKRAVSLNDPAYLQAKAIVAAAVGA
ncbi:MAG: beta-N-acetylhexosaminidase [Rhodocyclaceae bacterium]|nr:beta-N-acetylhexosaminidase [Rhodocyclaceae bacterium]